MIVLFTLITEGNAKNTDNFYNEVKEIAEKNNVIIHDFANEYMMPPINLFYEDQREMVLYQMAHKVNIMRGKKR